MFTRTKDFPVSRLRLHHLDTALPINPKEKDPVGKVDSR